MSDGQVHSVLGASSYHRWKRCPGSIALIKTLPPEAFTSSVFAEEGTDAHYYAAMCAANGLNPSGTHAGEEMEYEGRKFTPDDEMVDHIAGYLRYCRAGGDPAQIIHGFEERFDLSSVYAGCFGTNDFWHWQPAIGKLRVVDLKYGKGKRVRAKENEQLMYYALGAVTKLKLPVKTISIEIYQPRMAEQNGGEPHDVWECSVERLLDFAADLRDDCIKTEDPKAPLVSDTSPEGHCQFCPAKLTCPQRSKDLEEAARMNADLFSAVTVPPRGVEPDNRLAMLKYKIIWVLQRKDMLKKMITAADELAYAMAEAGHLTEKDGFKLVDKRGRRKYVMPESETIEELQALGVSDAVIYEKPALRSPAQLEAALSDTMPKKAAKQIVSALAEAKSTGHALVPVDDERPAAQVQSAGDLLTAIPAFLDRSNRA